MHKDQFSVSGAWGVGGFTTIHTLVQSTMIGQQHSGYSYKNNRWVGYFETDLMVNCL
ncbi:hypothetical protein O9992_02550 [Vibrio lentus]|nr:hypothetical protein [Vibrio lentus]